MKIDTTDYLYLILVPSAQAFRGQWEKGHAPFNAIRNFKQCRVKFFDSEKEKAWQKFCQENELKNSSELEY